MSEGDLRNVAAFYASLPAIASEPGAYVKLYLPYEKERSLPPLGHDAMAPDGNFEDPGMPSLAGQQPHYLVAATQEYLKGERKTDPMIRCGVG